MSVPGRHRRARRRPGERGSVTAELAIGLVAVTVVLVALCSVVVVGVAQVRVTDAAAAGARLAARGEADGVVDEAARRLAGDGATVTVGRSGGFTAVTVTRRVALALPGRPTVLVDSRAMAVAELSTAGGAATGDAVVVSAHRPERTADDREGSR